MPTYDITCKDINSVSSFTLKTHEKQTFRVAIVGESC